MSEPTFPEHSDASVSQQASAEQWIHVVAAVIQNSQGQILIAKRLSNQHQGGLWEFPGGKVEKDEEVFPALKRELKEELNIDIHSSQLFLQVRHRYSDKSIFLDIYKVLDFSGEAQGNEGQEIRWIDLDEVENFEFPKANTKIVKALKAPELLSICGADLEASFFLDKKINKTLQQISTLNIDTILLRLPLLSDEEYKACYVQVSNILDNAYSNKKIKILINRMHLFEDLKTCSGVHLSSKQLMSCSKRTLTKDLLLSASCHNVVELAQAERIGCDFVFISPVLETQSHVKAEILNWQGLEKLAESTALPVLALGGLHTRDLLSAKQAGALGVAGISNFGIDN